VVEEIRKCGNLPAGRQVRECGNVEMRKVEMREGGV
jgi:hypothetical protein